MAIVLFDASAPSLKALEAGCAAGYFTQHNRDQLVVLHATPPVAAAVPPAATAAAAAAAASTIGGNAAFAASVAHGRGSVAADSGAAAGADGANAGANAGGGAAAVAASVSAISQVVDNIHKNRYATASLNYKIETFRLGTTMPQTLAAQRAAAERAHQQRDDAAPAAAHITSGRGSVAHVGAPGAATSKASQQQSQQQAAAAAAAALLTAAAAAAAHDAATEPMTLQTVFAENVALRAAHHGARTVLLGVGSSGGHGKALSLGGFAKATIERLRRGKEVDCVGVFKPSGPPVRSTQPMRVVVVATPTTPFAAVKAALGRIANLSVQRGDFVGLLVVMNGGKAKPRSLVDALAALEQQRQQQAALGVGQGQQVQPPTSQEQLAMIKFDEEGAEAGAHWRGAVAATFKLAGDVARLGFLNQEERAQQLLQQQQRDQQGGGGDGDLSGRSGASGEGAAGAAAVAAAPSIAMSAATTAAAGFEGPPLLTTLFIEPTTRDPAPELESHTGCAQLSKAAAGLKTDYAVVLPESQTTGLGPQATASLLSAVRPHVLLV